MAHTEHIITGVEPGSIAEELELAPGDVLLSIDNQPVEDIFDYRFLTRSEELTLLIRRADGEEWELEIEKDEDEDLGLVFDGGLMDNYRSCSNKCIFCFIDQLPKGMRETLYFKDDDARLSFLQGNYITLTNLSDADLERIIRYRLQPINVSVHTTEPELRVRMLNNRFAGDALRKLKRLCEAEITMNGQIVLCKGVNDGEHLRRSIRDLSAMQPQMQSVSVVPVGLTRFREGLYPLEPFTKEDAIEVLEIIHEGQRESMARYGNHFIHAGDEWYLLAEAPLPDADNYDGYLQLANGVGMLRLLSDEFDEALADAPQGKKGYTCSIACGMGIAGFFGELINRFHERYPEITVHLYPIRNDFFGPRITVSGLLTGQDIIAQLRDQPLGDRLLLTRNLLRFGEDVLLDDIHVHDIETALHIPIRIVEGDGADLLAAMVGD